MNPAVVSAVQTLCSAGEKAALIKLFGDYCEHFSCIPLEESSVTDSQAIHDLVRENVSGNYVCVYS